VTAQEGGGAGSCDGAVEDAADDGGLPGTVAVKAHPAGGEALLHANGDGAAGDDFDAAADGDGVDGAGLAGEREDAGGEIGEIFCRDRVSWCFAE